MDSPGLPVDSLLRSRSMESTSSDETVPAIERAARLVEDYLRDFGDAFSKVDACSYFAKKGSALVSIRILPFADDAIVEVGANVVEGATLSQELLVELLEQNHSMVFGKFGLAKNGTITLQHALFGSTLDRPELVNAIKAVARTADEWDDKIVAKAGGQTALARLRDDARRKA
jgi:hypothetical protein